jgi:integrase
VSKAFNEMIVKALPIGKHFDPSTPAFGMRVGKNRRTWIVQRGTDRRIIRVGHYPAMTLAEARQKGKQLLSSTQLNHERVTFQQAYDLFKQVHVAAKKPRTQEDYERVLKRHYLPVLATKRLDAVTSHMVDGITDALMHTPSERIHAIAVGKTFFKFCIRRRFIDRSPLEAVQLPRPKHRKRILTDEELKTVWRAAEEFGGPYGALVRLIILTGMRRKECAALEHTWVQPDRITLPGHITKNSKEFCFPIGPTAQRILAGLKTNWHLLLPTYPTGPLPFNTFSVTKPEFDETHSVRNYTLHDLRRTYRSTLPRLKVAPHIAERLVNHTSARTELEEIYDHYQYWDEQVEAVQKYDNWLSSLLKLR